MKVVIDEMLAQRSGAPELPDYTLLDDEEFDVAAGGCTKTCDVTCGQTCATTSGNT